MRARRLAVVDEYADGDQLAVFARGEVLVLSAVATAALRAVGGEWTDLHAVRDAVVAAVGPPPGEPEAAVATLVRELADAGLVEVTPLSTQS